MSGGRGGQDDM